MIQRWILNFIALVFIVVVSLPTENCFSAQDKSKVALANTSLNITLGMQGGLGLFGQLGLGGRFFVLHERQGIGLGLGSSFLVGNRQIFVPSLVNVVKVSGITFFTEILFQMSLAPITLQSAVGMAIVGHQGQTKRNLPVQLTSHGLHMGMDVRYALNDNLSLYTSGRWVFLDHGLLTIAGWRKTVPLDVQPALLVGLAWSF